MERLCDTGVKPLGRKLKVMKSGAIMVMGSHGRLPEVVWWPPIEIAKEVFKNWRDFVYSVDDDGYLMRTWDPPELYMDVWDV